MNNKFLFNKRAQSTGVAWFFGMIVIFVILLLFYLVMQLTSLTKSSSAAIDEKYFYEVQNAKALRHFLEYEDSLIYNPTKVFIVNKEDDKFAKLFFDYVQSTYGLSKDDFKKDKEHCFVFLRRERVNDKNTFVYAIGSLGSIFHDKMLVSFSDSNVEGVPNGDGGDPFLPKVVSDSEKIKPNASFVYVNDISEIGVGAGGFCNEYVK